MNGVSRHPHDSVPACASHADRLLPLRDDRKLALELRLVGGLDREDAVQEAWLALLEGRNPARAVNTFARRERRHRRRMVPILN
jgi:hypothetical protein